MTQDVYPTAYTPDEEAEGFGHQNIPNQLRGFGEPATVLALVLDLGNGAAAVKVADPDGRIHYAIMDAKTLRPIAPPVDSLAELRRRFPSTH